MELNVYRLVSRRISQNDMYNILEYFIRYVIHMYMDNPKSLPTEHRDALYLMHTHV